MLQAHSVSKCFKISMTLMKEIPNKGFAQMSVIKFELNHEYGISKEVVQFPFEKSCFFNSI